MNRNIKYKQVCRLVLNCNDDLLKSSASSQYSCTNTAIVNSKIIRFSLNNSLSDVILSQNAKCVLESCHIPNITNLTNQIAYLRLVTSSQNKTYDFLFDTGSSLFELWTTKSIWNKFREKSSNVDEFPISSWGKINNAYRSTLNRNFSICFCNSIKIKNDTTRFFNIRTKKKHPYKRINQKENFYKSSKLRK